MDAVTMTTTTTNSTSMFGNLVQNSSRVLNISKIDLDNGNMNLYARAKCWKKFLEFRLWTKWFFFLLTQCLFLLSPDFFFILLYFIFFSWFFYIVFTHCPCVHHFYGSPLKHQSIGGANLIRLWWRADILYEVPVGIIVLLSIFYGSISIIAVIGNSLVIWIVATTRQMQTVTNLFIANLALADVVIGMFVIPFQVIFSLSSSCYYFFFFFFLCFHFSFFNFLHCLSKRTIIALFGFKIFILFLLIYWISFSIKVYLIQIYSFALLNNEFEWTGWKRNR